MGASHTVQLTFSFFLIENRSLACGGVAKWLTCWISNLRIAGPVGSNPVRGKPMFPLATNFKFIAQYWLVLGTDLEVFQ
jgi:hypothetical protein